MTECENSWEIKWTDSHKPCHRWKWIYDFWNYLQKRKTTMRREITSSSFHSFSLCSNQLHTYFCCCIFFIFHFPFLTLVRLTVSLFFFLSSFKILRVHSSAIHLRIAFVSFFLSSTCSSIHYVNPFSLPSYIHVFRILRFQWKKRRVRWKWYTTVDVRNGKRGMQMLMSGDFLLLNYILRRGGDVLVF